MLTAASILFAAGFAFPTCLALGKSLLKILRVRLYRAEELFFGFVLGAAILSLLVFLLSAAGLAYSSVFFALGLAAIGAATAFGAMRFTNDRQPPLPRPWPAIFWSIYAVFGALYLISALRPDTSADGLMYHVHFPALYFREHRIPAVTTDFLGSLSQGTEILYLFTFSFGRHSSAAMTHLLFLLLLPVGILSYAKRIGAPVAGVVASILVFASPAAGLSGSTPYIDIAVTCVVFAIFSLVQLWREQPRDSLLLPIGLLGGFAYAMKYTAFLALVYAAMVMIVKLWRLRKPLLRPLAIVAFCAAVTMVPWMIKNAIVVHNPLAPFANRVFPNPYMYVSNEQTWQNMRSLHGESAWRLPYELTTRGDLPQGFLGPVFLLAPLALLALRFPAGRQLLLAAAILFVAYPFALAVRYFLPILPLLALSMGLVLARWKWVAFGIVLLHAILSWPPIVPKYASRRAPRLELPDWKAALRITPESQYLERNIDSYGVGALLESRAAPADRAFSFGVLDDSYLTHEVITEWQSSLGIRLGEALRGAAQPAFFPSERCDFRFAPRTVQKLRLLQTAASPQEWNVSELRLYRSGIEIDRRPQWRLRASPNSGDVALAFDNSPLTRWSSREPSRPGMYIEVDLGEPQMVDELAVSRVAGQFGTRMEIESISAAMEVSQVDSPPRLRRAAIEELGRHGIRWLVIHDLDPEANDFRSRPLQWGIELAGRSGRYSLYRLQ